MRARLRKWTREWDREREREINCEDGRQTDTNTHKKKKCVLQCHGYNVFIISSVFYHDKSVKWKVQKKSAMNFYISNFNILLCAVLDILHLFYSSKKKTKIMCIRKKYKTYSSLSVFSHLLTHTGTFIEFKKKPFSFVHIANDNIQWIRVLQCKRVRSPIF